MAKRKLLLITSVILVLFFAIIFYNYKMPIKLDPINTKDVELINRVGGVPLSRWKVLYASKDNSTINNIITMVNLAKKTGFNERDYGVGKEIGYPISIEIKLKNNVKWRISPLFKINYQTLKNGSIEFTAIPYKDRIEFQIENGNKNSFYTAFSEQLANYVLKGADQDMPHVSAFSIMPNKVKPGQTVTISGDGSTEDYMEIYITDGNSASNEKYLIAKVPTSFGSWKWEDTINGRNIKTLDGKEIKLTRDTYQFQTSVAGGGEIDLSGTN